jgi:riboflavin kinase/FMN adenylyltransferase
MIFDTMSPLPVIYQNAVIAIGNFDAVHRGHQALLEMGRKRALHLGKAFGVLTFEPHPRTLFKPNDPQFRITPATVKHELLKKYGADFIVSMPFTTDTIKLSASDFVRKILQDYLFAHTIICGADFHFGHNRSGSVNDIEEKGIYTIIIDPLKDSKGLVYSASRIRDDLRKGDISTASHLLGWDYFIRGIVEKGEQRGRMMDYPTANISLDNVLSPAYGVYAGFVRHKNNIYKAAINIGVRPTFGGLHPRLETHIFDFKDDIYGDEIDVVLKEKIRDEMKFESIDHLKKQIEKDCVLIKSILR